jgi:beta-galactosidase
MNVWRAPLALEVDGWDQWNITYNNRKAWNGAQIANEFYSNNLNAITRIPISCQAFEANGQVYVNVRWFSQFGVPVNTSLDAYITGLRYSGFSEVYEYRINGDGTIALHHILEPEGPMPALLPRIGLTMTLCDEMQQVKWYGRGPEENYHDRKTGYAIGIYEKTVDDMFEPYLIPQDCGLRCDNRWLDMSNGSGQGLRFEMDEPFNFNAYHYSTDNLTKAVYTYQLQQQDGITLNLDYNTTGVGCTACYVLPGYQVKPTRYERRLTIKPISN